MAITAANLKDCFDDFDNEDPTRIAKFITQAENRMSSTQWGESKFDDGVLYLTAHLLTMSKQGNKHAAGPVTSRTVARVSTSYATPTMFMKSALSSTAYGRYFLDLQRLIFPCRKL